MTALPSFVASRPRTQGALGFGRQAHADQTRQGDEAPFILHPLEVAGLLDAHGFDDDVTAAAVLHDVLERTGVACEDLEQRFGPRVAHIVAALTEDESIEDHEARKAALREQVGRADDAAAAVFAADKVSKVRELRIRLTWDPEAGSDPRTRAKLGHYDQSLTMLEGRLGRHPLVAELRVELELLRAFPPRARGGRDV